LEHPHIARVLDEGRIPHGLEEHDLVAGSPYFAMELVTGTTLREVANGPLDFRAVKTLLLGMLDALSHAHARDIIHRDLKPGNVLVSVDEFGQLSPHLVDFGVAHAMSPGAAEWSAIGRVTRGTPRYMAPEQILDDLRDQGPWTDLYALGCIAFVLATGHPPYRGTLHEDTLRAHLEDPIPKLKCRFDVPAEFEDWVRTLLAKSPVQRFRSAPDAAWALEQLDVDHGELSEPMAVADSVPTVVITTGSFDRSEWQAQAEPSLGVRTETPGKRMTAPPMPRSWRRRRPKASSHLLGAGLGLYALRPVPLVGRESERDLLWQRLADAHGGGVSRAVVVRGPSGVGKTRLLQWFCERAQEVGAATTFHVTHNKQPGPLDGIRGALTRTFRVGGMSRAEAGTRILNRLSIDSELDDLAIFDAIALAEMALTDGTESGGPAERVRFSDRREQWVVLERWLARLAAKRPIIVWVDDAQWSREALRFVEYVLEAGTPGVLFVLSLRDDALAERPERESEVAELLSRPECESFDLGPLDDEAHGALVRQLIGLDEKLARAVEKRTAGNPLFAVQLVGDWVERGLLLATDTGFALADDMPALPDDLHEVWGRRIERVAEQAGSIVAPMALEVAACLGQSFELRELEAALDAIDMKLPVRLLDELLAARLAEYRSDSGVVTFVHPMLVESLERRSREAGRWTTSHFACARALRAVHGDDDMRVIGAIGRHYLEAGEPREALGPLLAGARRAVEGRDTEAARILADARERALDQLGMTSDSRHVLESRLIHAWLAEGNGDMGSALAEAEAVARLSRSRGWLDLVGQAYCICGKIARRTSAEESEAYLELAIEALEEDGTEIGELAKAQLSSGWNLARLHHYEEGLRRMREALANFERIDDAFWAVSAHNAIGFHLSQMERWTEAGQAYEAALEAAHKCGSRTRLALTYCHMGEFERHHERWQTAREYYQKAEELERSVGGPNALIYFYNQALVAMGEEDWAGALATLTTLHADRGALANMNIALDAGLAYLACLAAVGDWARFDAEYPRIKRLVETTGPLDLDMQRNARRAVQFCDEQGEVGRAGQMHDLLEHEHVSNVLES
jgi:tetratricopeptide (TPR) repeat protein